ncbi:MAG TPA: hypothetical protein VFG04_20760 [Planctomycetaceae bacterium]|jgi:hypothetical protein|nr:hypothetical protein [Planctomycetaceae bacterium]
MYFASSLNGGVSVRARMIPFLVGIALLVQSSSQAQDNSAKKRSPQKAGKAEAAEPAADDGPKLIVRVYPVQDLLRTQADYPYRGGLNGDLPGRQSSPAARGGGAGVGGGMGGGGMFAIPSTARPPQVLRQFGGGGGGAVSQNEERENELLEIIDAGVKGNWGEDGIEKRLFRGNLIVRNTADVHESLATFLRALRTNGDGGRSVVVEATWLLLTPQQLETLRQPSGDHQASRSAVSRKAFDEVSRQTTAIHGRITCLNGQQVHLATGRRQVISSGGTPTVGVGATGYQPTISVINLGAVLQVTPSISGDSKALVDLQNIVTQWKEPGGPIQVTSQAAAGSSEKQAAGPIVSTMLTIDRADVGTQEWSTTVSIPIGEPVYVGSVTLTNDKASHLEAGQNPELALVLEVRPD